MEVSPVITADEAGHRTIVVALDTEIESAARSRLGKRTILQAWGHCAYGSRLQVPLSAVGGFSRYLPDYCAPHL